MIGAEMPGDRLCVFRLVVALLSPEFDGEGLYRSRGLGLHQCHDRGRVDPTGEKCAQGHIGNHLSRYGPRQQPFQRLYGLGVASRERRGNTPLGDVACRPVRLLLARAVGRTERKVPGVNLRTP